MPRFLALIERWKRMCTNKSSLSEASNVLLKIAQTVALEQYGQVVLLQDVMKQIEEVLGNLSRNALVSELSLAICTLEDTRATLVFKSNGNVETTRAIINLLGAEIDKLYIRQGSHRKEDVVSLWCLFVSGYGTPEASGHVRKLYASDCLPGEPLCGKNIAMGMQQEIQRAVREVFCYLYKLGLNKGIYTQEGLRFDIDGRETFDGSSIGLGAAVATLAIVLGLKVPDEMALTGCLGVGEKTGTVRLAGVNGLKEKIDAAKRFQKQVVAPGNGSQELPDHVRLVDTLEQAFEKIWGDNVKQKIVQAILKKNEPKALEEEFENLAQTYMDHKRDAADFVTCVASRLCQRIQAFGEHSGLKTIKLKTLNLQMKCLVHLGRAREAFHIYKSQVLPLLSGTRRDQDRVQEKFRAIQTHAIICSDLYDFDKAIEDLGIWLKNNNDSDAIDYEFLSSCYGTLGHICMLAGRYKDAEATLKKGLDAAQEIESEDARARASKADQLYRKHFYLAQTFIRRANAEKNLSVLKVAGKHFCEADKLNLQMEVGKRDYNAYFLDYGKCELMLTYGMLSGDCEKLKKVLTLAGETVQKKEDYPSILMLRDQGRALRLLGQPKAAIRVFQKSLTMAPKLEKVSETIQLLRCTSRLELVRTFLQQGCCKEAEEEIETVREIVAKLRSQIDYEPFQTFADQRLLKPIDELRTLLRARKNDLACAEPIIDHILSAIPY